MSWKKKRNKSVVLRSNYLRLKITLIIPKYNRISKTTHLLGFSFIYIEILITNYNNFKYLLEIYERYEKIKSLDKNREKFFPYYYY